MEILNSGIIDALPVRALEFGEILIEESGHGTEIFFLKTGAVEVLKSDTLITTEAEPGAVFGEMSVLLGSVSTATVKVIAPSVFYVAENGAEFLRSNPELSLYLATVLAMRLEAVTRYLADVKSQYAEEGTHLGMVDSLLSTLMVRHPRRVERGNRGH